MIYLIIGLALPFLCALLCRIFNLDDTDTYCVFYPFICVSMFIVTVGLLVILGVM